MPSLEHKAHGSDPLPFSSETLVKIQSELTDNIYHTAQGSLTQEEQLVESAYFDLLANAEQFKRIFRTEEGSTYFVTEDEASLRFKQKARGVHKIQPVLMKQLFIDENTVSLLMNPRNMLGRPIIKQPYQIGATPLEFGVNGLNSNLSYIEDESSITFLPTASSPLNNYHIGNKVAEIIR